MCVAIYRAFFVYYEIFCCCLGIYFRNSWVAMVMRFAPDYALTLGKTCIIRVLPFLRLAEGCFEFWPRTGGIFFYVSRRFSFRDGYCTFSGNNLRFGTVTFRDRLCFGTVVAASTARDALFVHLTFFGDGRVIFPLVTFFCFREGHVS